MCMLGRAGQAGQKLTYRGCKLVEQSQLQELGQKASGAVSKAADAVRDAFTDDNVLEYCSLDQKVSFAVASRLCQLCQAKPGWPRVAGWQAPEQSVFGRERARVSWSFECKELPCIPNADGFLCCCITRALYCLCEWSHYTNAELMTAWCSLSTLMASPLCPMRSLTT